MKNAHFKCLICIKMNAKLFTPFRCKLLFFPTLMVK
uniref:Uncharacterized protein n=1 Tax=Anguilla anguilla TaxID=7936 RepID=A0A0E9RWP0_ANGAN